MFAFAARARQTSAELPNITASGHRFFVGGVETETGALLINGKNYIGVAEFAELLDIDVAFDKTTNAVYFDKALPFTGVRDAAPYAANFPILPDGVSQLVIVKSDNADAEIFFFEKNDAGIWEEVTAMRAAGFVGEGGAGEASEGALITPAGLFMIAEAFYIGEGLDTGLDSFKITNETYWVDDPNSRHYNSRVEGAALKDWASAERMAGSPASYAAGFVIGYNTERTPGAGSAIFFHIGTKPTSGCVAVSKETCEKYLKALDKTKRPHIFIY